MENRNSGLEKGLAGALTSVFGHSPTIISDSPLVIEQLTSLGCLAFGFMESEGIAPKLRKNVVIVATKEETMPPYAKLHALFRNSRVLLIPLLSFDSTSDAIFYTLELISRSDFDAAVKANKEWLLYLLEPNKPLTLQGNGSNLICEIEEGVYVMRPKTETLLLPGEWDSIGSYFEVGMVPPPDSLRPAFVVNGTLRVPGVAVAHHRQMHKSMLPVVREAWSLFQDLRKDNCFPLELELENSRVIQARAGTLDILPKLAELSNEERELILTEMAFSTNTSITAKELNWEINSQMNEGVVGIHIAIGDGLTGAHIDFICPGVRPIDADKKSMQ